MGLFKSGKAKADDLLTILIPALEFELREEIRRRLSAQMEETVQVVANRVIRYGYDQAIKELNITVNAPAKPWVSLSDVDKHVLKMQHDKVKVVYTDNQKDLSILGQDVNVDELISAIEAKLKEKNGGV